LQPGRGDSGFERFTDRPAGVNYKLAGP
jgi:hypothetical protein